MLLIKRVLIFETNKNQGITIMAKHNELGRWGEQKAVEYLVGQGYYIRHRDWQYKHRDLDIVAIDADQSTLVFVEVKTRSTDMFGDPAQAIDLEKANNLMIAANAYLRTYRMENMTIRYDSIAIVGDNDDNFRLEHQRDIIDVTLRYRYRQQKAARARYKRPGNWGNGTWGSGMWR